MLDVTKRIHAGIDLLAEARQQLDDDWPIVVEDTGWDAPRRRDPRSLSPTSYGLLAGAAVLMLRRAVMSSRISP